MATQVMVEELDGCKPYIEWIYDVLSHVYDESCKCKLVKSAVSRELCRVLFDMDFTWVEDVKDDQIRAEDALDVRRKYAESVGEKAGKSEREVDRIWKSIHGKSSVLELLFSLCEHLDEMVNEGEQDAMIGFFYRILVHNLALDEFGDNDFRKVLVVGKDTSVPDIVLQRSAAKAHPSVNSLLEKAEIMAEEKRKNGQTILEKAEIMAEENRRRQAEIREIWVGRVKKWMRREYFESGCCGGVFPLHQWKSTDKDQRKVSLWYQMNAWLCEHLDDDAYFICENLE